MNIWVFVSYLCLQKSKFLFFLKEENIKYPVRCNILIESITLML